FQIRQRPINVIETSLDRPKFGAVNLISYELASKPEKQNFLIEALPDVTVLDERQKLGNFKSKRTQATYGHDRQGFNSTDPLAYATASPITWALSGTPIPNNVSQMWPMLRALLPQTIKRRDGTPMGYWDFVNRYCIVKRTPF